MFNDSGTFLVVRPVTTRGLVYDLCGGLPLIDDSAVAARISDLVSLELRKLRTSPTRFVEIALASGQKLDVDLHDDFGAKLAHGYFQEASDWNVVSRLFGPGMTAIDVGANVGVYTLELARRAGPEGCVIAFEPIPEIAATLRGNVDKNGYENVVLRREAASRTEGMAEFFVAENASLSGLFPTSRNEASNVTEVPLVPLDTVAELADLPVDFLKIDAEGAEADVLAGARALIARSPEIVIMLEYSAKNINGVKLEQFLSEIELLVRNGFRVFPGNAASTPLQSFASHELRPGSTGNFFLCRHGGEGEARFLRATSEVASTLPSLADATKRLTSTIAASLRLARAAEVVRASQLVSLASILAKAESTEGIIDRLGKHIEAVDEKLSQLEPQLQTIRSEQALMLDFAQRIRRDTFAGVIRRLLQRG